MTLPVSTHCLWPVKAKHICTLAEGDYYPSSEEIPNLDRERYLAAVDYLENELKWTEKVDFTTKWSPDRDILWLTFNNEQIVRALYRRLADLGNKRIRLIKFVPPWPLKETGK